MTRDEALTVRDRADLKAKYPSLKARRTQQARAEFDADSLRMVVTHDHP